jgi:membrane fusion protein, multidrug efflux system
LSMDDVNIGTYAAAGTTGLVTISSTNPVYVQFDMSETEYLEMARKNTNREKWGGNLKLRLSDGQMYSETGHVVQVNPGLTSGQMSLKAAFDNSQGLLVPGMYGTIVSDAEVASDVLLIPTQAIIQLLNRNLVDVVEDGKVVQKAIEIGGTYGIYTIVKSGITTEDVIIVEGQGKVRAGQAVTPEEIAKDALAEKITAQNKDSKSTGK